MPANHWTLRHRKRPITCLGDVAEVADGGASEFARVIPRNYSWRKLIRKWWEWDYLAHCAEAVGAVHPGSTAIGLGVGQEPLMYYFASRCGRVIATDMYSSDASWGDAKADQETMYANSPIRYDRSRLEFRNADMRATRQPDGTCDLLWSTSTIEHVGNMRELVATYREIHRVLKPGGHAVLTTEFCVTEPPLLQEDVTAHDQLFFDRVVRRLGGLEVVGPIDLSFNSAHPGNAAGSLRHFVTDWGLTGRSGVLFDSGTGSGRPWATFRPGTCTPGSPVGSIGPYFRSGQMGVQFGSSVIVPIGIVLKKVGRSVRRWEEYDLPDEWRLLPDAQHLTAQGQLAEALALTRRLIHGFGPATPAQLRTQALSLYARLLMATGTPLDAAALKPIRDGLDELSNVGLIDSAMHHCGTILYMAGDIQGSADVYWACMTTPSTNMILALQLGLAYVRSMKLLGLFGPAIGTFAVVFRDLVTNGAGPAEVIPALNSGLAWASSVGYFDAGELRTIRAAVADELRHWGVIFAGRFNETAEGVVAAGSQDAARPAA